MPWSTADVDRFRKGLADEDKEQWVAVANHTRLACLEDGGTETECDAQAVKMANAAMAEVWLELAVPEPVWLEIDIDEGGPGSGNFGHAGIPGQRGGSAPAGAVGMLIDENMTAEEAQREWGDSEKQAKANNQAIERDIKDFGQMDRSLRTRQAAASLTSEDADERSAYLAIAAWTATSNDSNAVSLTIQKSAEERFGSPMTEWQKARKSSLQSSVDGKQATAILDKSYSNTQAHLRSLGIGPGDYVTVYRGAAMPKGDAAKVSGRAGIIRDNSLVSVSMRRAKAAQFASTAREALPSTHVAGVQTLRVRGRDIVGMPRTGFGNAGEYELVVLGRGNLGTFEEA